MREDYRIVHDPIDGEDFYRLSQVQYTDGGDIVNIYDTDVCGETVDEICDILREMVGGLFKPIVTQGDFAHAISGDLYNMLERSCFELAEGGE